MNKIKYTTENISVYPIDKELLDKTINNYLQVDHPNKEVFYHTMGRLAIIKNPSLNIIDDEFIGHSVTKDEIIFYIYKSGNNWHEMTPSYSVALSIDEIEKHLLKPITLAKFTVNRRGYNSRIKSNEHDWIEYLNCK